MITSNKKGAKLLPNQAIAHCLKSFVHDGVSYVEGHASVFIAAHLPELVAKGLVAAEKAVADTHAHTEGGAGEVKTAADAASGAEGQGDKPDASKTDSTKTAKKDVGK